jgi:hypothetical protein
MKHVIIRVAVDDATLEALAQRNGTRRATLKDFRQWLAALVEAEVDDLASQAPA